MNPNMQAASLHEAPEVNAIPTAQTVTDETLSVTIATADGGCKHRGRETRIQEQVVVMCQVDRYAKQVWCRQKGTCP